MCILISNVLELERGPGMAAIKQGVRDYTFWMNGKLYDEIESLVEADIEAGNNRANVKAFLTEAALRLVYLRKGEEFTDYRTEIRKYIP